MRRLHLRLTTALVTALGALVVAAPPSSAIIDKDCGDFASQRAAQIFFLKHGGPSSDPHRLDGSDNDGKACESNPAPYYYGTSLPDSDPKPVKVRSTVNLALNRRKAISGESVRLTASVRPRGVRSVVFQRRAGQRWRTFDRDRTNRRGKTSHTIRAPRNATKYRVVLAAKKSGNKSFSKAVSDSRTLRIQRQRVTLTLSKTSVPQAGSVRALVDVSPVRSGRVVELQVIRNGAWDTIRTGRQNRRGREVFSVPTAQVGDFHYRAVTTRHRGAGAKASTRHRLTVRDVTAPDAPADLDATAGDGTVALSWSPSVADDVETYAVFVRVAPDAPWSELAGTTETSYLVDDLQNGTTYWFAIRSVDHSGNLSTRSTTSATPTAPVVPAPAG